MISYCKSTNNILNICQFLQVFAKLARIISFFRLNIRPYTAEAPRDETLRWKLATTVISHRFHSCCNHHLSSSLLPMLLLPFRQTAGHRRPLAQRLHVALHRQHIRLRLHDASAQPSCLTAASQCALCQRQVQHCHHTHAFRTHIRLHPNPVHRIHQHLLRPFPFGFYRLMKLKKSGDFVFSLIFDFQTHEITKATSINLAAFVICIHSAVSISKSVFIGCINSDHMSRSRHKECHHNHKNHSSRSFHYNN